MMAIIWGLALAGCQSTDCPDLARQAAGLVDAASSCEAGEVCEVVAMGSLVSGSCIGAFQCVSALNADIDKDDFRRMAKTIEKKHSSCGVCVMAGCVGPDSFVAQCNSDKGRCELVMK